MICTIHQPNYLPYPGFFEKAYQADIFVTYDTAQFTKNGMQNRNRICVNNSWRWLSMPVVHNLGQQINGVKIDLTKKPLRKHWSTIKSVYGGAPFFREYSEVFKDIYSREYTLIADLNLDLILSIAEIFEIRTKFIKSSELPPINSSGTQALIDICKNVNADTYIAGSSGKKYIQPQLFDKAGIKLVFQNFKHPEYSQFNSSEFMTNMCSLDLIFNCGPESLKVILSANG